MKLSLGILLACCLAGLQFLAVIIVVSSQYVSSERVLLDHARNLLSDVATNSSEHAKGFLAPARGAAELAARLAENRIVASEDAQRVEQFLFQQMLISPQFAGVYYGDRDGNFVYVKHSEDRGDFRTKIIQTFGEGRETELIWRDRDFLEVQRQSDPADLYDPRTRPWYVKAGDAGGSVWTEPYIFFSSQKPGITVAAPVTDEDGGIKGVVGVDIEIDAISRFLSGLHIGETGTAVFVNANGDVIAHPDQALLKEGNRDGTFRFVNIREIEDPVARAAFGMLPENGLSIDRETFSKFELNGDTYIATVLPPISEQLPWTIGVFAPEADFIGAIQQNQTRNIWLAAAVAFVTAIVGLMLAHFIHRPVKAFAVRAALISQGEIDPDAPTPKTYKELDLANATLMREISQRKQTEEEYGQTFDLSSRGMVQMAPATGRFTRVNPTFSEVTGYSAGELANITIRDLIHPDEAEIQSGAQIDAEDLNGDWRIVRKDGEIVWVSITSILIRDAGQLPLHIVAMIDDISAAKQAEAQIQSLNRDLSHIARGEVLGQMASGLAHELNQPLTAIAQNADTAILTAREDDTPNPELLSMLSDIEREALRGGEIIRALRAFARKGEEARAPFDFHKLLRQSLHLLRAEATEHNVRIRVSDSAIPKVVGIRVQIAQVIVNLVRNAIEAIAESGTKTREIRISTRLDGAQVEVTVEDTGPGIRPGFKTFSQFETTKRDGMGLGLTICRSIVEAMDGRLWLDESYDQGARFRFTIPAEAETGVKAVEKLSHQNA